MDKGFRTAQCSGCQKKIQFPVTPAQYGQTVKVRCRGCKTVGQVTIPVPSEHTAPPVPPPPVKPKNPFLDFGFDLDSWSDAFGKKH